MEFDDNYFLCEKCKQKNTLVVKASNGKYSPSLKFARKLRIIPEFTELRRKCEFCGNEQLTFIEARKASTPISDPISDPNGPEPLCPMCGMVVWEGDKCPECGVVLFRSGNELSTEEPTELLPEEQQPPEESEPKAALIGMVREYKRTCLRCGKVWYSSIAREQSLHKDLRNYSLKSTGDYLQALGSFSSKGHGQYDGAKIATESELVKLKQCPSCSSVSYNEEIV